MAIIIQGIDNSGKTTLANKIASALNYEIYHPGGPTHPYYTWEQRAHEQLELASKDVVMDRHFILDEATYGDVLRPNEKHPQLRTYLQMLKDTNAIFIYCRPSDYDLMNFKNHKVKNYESKKHVDSVMQHQLTLMHRTDEVMKWFDPIYHNYRHQKNENILIFWLENQ